ncbi:type II restriction endonuclease [Microbulbifer sp. SAOS-129_SWC]|uniref:type II restriction endonuclease n=1 Tax=Microbulbifer sp. SAOS-129_SWC TaxID=3145235 RepID=UPI003217348E
MSLFDQVKKDIPSNNILCKAAAEEIFSGKSKEDIKENFSQYVTALQNRIYEKYLEHEQASAQSVIDQQIQEKQAIYFPDLNKLTMSLSQSRKSRAGKAFEGIFQELFSRLGYSYSDQVDIDGAKPDFVMPSEEYFREKPLESIIFTAKRTLRERWRQVVTEANKGYSFFLATFDEKISSNQIEQAAKHKIYVVVPKPLKNDIPHYKSSYNVLSFEEFLKLHLDPAVQRWRATEE